MPIYEYECSSCCNVFEIFQRMTEDPVTSCPDCSGPVTKLVSRSSFQLKGGGWYADGYSSNTTNGSGSTSNNKPAESTPAKSEDKSNGSSESAPSSGSKTDCSTSVSAA